MRTSWLRVRTPVLSNSCCITAFTELSEISSLPAISLFETFEDRFKNRALASAQEMGSSLGFGPSGGARHKRSHRTRIEPHFAFRHFMNCIHQLSGRAMLQKDSRGPAFERAQCLRIAHAGGHHQNMALETALGCGFEEGRSLLFAQIVVEQNHIHPLAIENR